MECDSCIGTKRKPVNFCLLCQASFCDTHVIPHHESPAFKRHKLVEASSNFQEKICSQHKMALVLYCSKDKSLICYECLMHEHKGHDTVKAEDESQKKQSELKEVQRTVQQRRQEKLKKVKEVKQAVETLKSSTQAAVNDSEKIFNRIMDLVRKLIRDQEKAEVSRAEGVLEQLEQEIADLKRRDAELEQFLHTKDHIHFLQNFQSLCGSSGSEDSSSIDVQHPSFKEVRKFLSELEKGLEEFCRKKFSKIPIRATGSRIILPQKPKGREEFLKYFHHFTLDPSTAHSDLIISEDNREVTRIKSSKDRDLRIKIQDVHPDRFQSHVQVLSKESVCGFSYWEVEPNGRLSISVSYKGIREKGQGFENKFGHNNQSWSLNCSSNTLSFWHNNIKTEILGSPPRIIGVYVDHSAGILSFYGISDTMTLLHRVHTIFTQPLYAGFRLFSFCTTVKFCDRQ